MKDKQERAGELAELERIVAAVGADAARWPAAARGRLSALVARDPQAALIVAEARAVDRLLDAAPVVRTAATGLADRIVAAALAAEVTRTTAEVIPLPRRAVPGGGRPAVRTGWRAAAAMAASLVAGIYLGGSVNLAPVLQDLADAAGIAIELEGFSMAMTDDAGDEDTL